MLILMPCNQLIHLPWSSPPISSPTAHFFVSPSAYIPVYFHLFPTRLSCDFAKLASVYYPVLTLFACFFRLWIPCLSLCWLVCQCDWSPVFLPCLNLLSKLEFPWNCDCLFVVLLSFTLTVSGNFSQLYIYIYFGWALGKNSISFDLGALVITGLA